LHNNSTIKKTDRIVVIDEERIPQKRATEEEKFVNLCGGRMTIRSCQIFVYGGKK